jgi:hypothetical protein
VNQSAPSGPVTIVYGRLSGTGSGNSVTDPGAVELAGAAPADATSGTARAKPRSVQIVQSLSMHSLGVDYPRGNLADKPQHD